jgi:hypothetical protein
LKRAAAGAKFGHCERSEAISILSHEIASSRFALLAMTTEMQAAMLRQRIVETADDMLTIEPRHSLSAYSSFCCNQSQRHVMV